jgi:hypothetical protein
MERFAFVMLFDALIDVFAKANIISPRMRYGAYDINVKHGWPLPAVTPAAAGAKAKHVFSQPLWRASDSLGATSLLQCMRSIGRRTRILH